MITLIKELICPPKFKPIVVKFEIRTQVEYDDLKKILKRILHRQRCSLTDNKFDVDSVLLSMHRYEQCHAPNKN